jgi:hypothetical protein
MKRFAGIEPFGGVKRTVSPSSPTNSQTAELVIRFLRRALIRVTGRLVFEQADDLQISRFHEWANHLDGPLDAQRLGGK